MQKLFLLPALMLLLACTTEPAASDAVSANKLPAETAVTAEIHHLGSQEVKNLLTQERVVVVDVRTPAEFAEGHLQRAQLIDWYAPDFAERIKALDPAQPYLLYCASGGRSGEASKMMLGLGFTHVYNATEGFIALKQAGVPQAGVPQAGAHVE